MATILHAGRARGLVTGCWVRRQLAYLEVSTRLQGRCSSGEYPCETRSFDSSVFWRNLLSDFLVNPVILSDIISEKLSNIYLFSSHVFLHSPYSHRTFVSYWHLIFFFVHKCTMPQCQVTSRERERQARCFVSLQFNLTIIFLFRSVRNRYYQVSSCQEPLKFSNYLWEFYMEEVENVKELRFIKQER